MAAVGTDVYVVWSQSGSIYFAASSINGSSFSSAIVLSNGINSSETPVIAAYGNDVYVAFNGMVHLS